ncbi:MAG TPA: GPW/gp25 family protein [Pyrinomonadaceae bacterium]|nr:GPW/gp25 family protein [Pyrinomonadaceae bacterium]
MALPVSNKEFLGVGWSFPVATTGGQASMVQYEDDIRQAILIILLTDNDERMMRPTFGAGLNRFLFEPVNPTTMAGVQTRVHDALIDFEPRIDVIEVTVTPSPKSLSTVLINITYRVRATNSVGNLVYPFYLGEGSTP